LIGYINTAGIHTDEQVEGWKKVTKRVHDKGGKIFIQLWHVGRMSHPDFHNGALPLSASAINLTMAFTQKDLKLLLRQEK
jgi:N-ethylmaleimide reductase